MLWWLLWYQVTLYNSNILGISIDVSEQSFPNYVLKFLATSLGWGCYDSKLLKIIISHLLKSVNWRSELSCHQMYSKMLRQLSKRSLISISSESSKIHLSVKVLYRPTWFNLCRLYFLFNSLNVFLCY